MDTSWVPYWSRWLVLSTVLATGCGLVFSAWYLWTVENYLYDIVIGVIVTSAVISASLFYMVNEMIREQTA